MDAPFSPTETALRFRFGVFEADAATGELRRAGVRVKLSEQPFQLLLLLLARPGEVLGREELAREMWPDGTFVDFEHGVNSAMNRIREALGDSARNPRFVETLARRGYRFIAPVERLAEGAAVETGAAVGVAMGGEVVGGVATSAAVPEEVRGLRILPTAADLPSVSRRTAQTLFVLLQVMYLGFYVGALANLGEIEDLLSAMREPHGVWVVLLVTASVLIPVRVFLLAAALLHPPDGRRTLLRLWAFVLPLDVLWSLAPFLLLRHMSAGLALACVAPLVYSPFAQRSLILMGAAEREA